MPDDLERMIGGFLSGKLTAEELRALDQRLVQDADARRELLRAADMDVAIRQILAEEHEVAGVPIGEACAVAEIESPEPTAVSGVRRRRAAHTGRRAAARHPAPARWTVFALSVTAAAAAVVLFAMMGAEPPAPRDETRRRLAETPRSADRHQPRGVSSTATKQDATPAGGSERVAQVKAGPAEEAVSPSPPPEHEFAVLPEPPTGAETEPFSLPPTEPSKATAGATSIAFFAAVEGTVELWRRGGTRWLRAKAETNLDVGDRVRTKYSRARIRYESGTLLFVNRFTTLTLEVPEPSPGLSLVGGEVLIVTATADKGFWVATPHGRAVDLGTRFGLDVQPRGTRVVVVEGTVKASTEKGAVQLHGRQEVLLARLQSPPGKVREARDIDKRLAWAMTGSVSGRRVIFREDFSGLPLGEWPRGWRKNNNDRDKRSGFVVLRDAARPANRCLGYDKPASGLTQHAGIPTREWGASFVLAFRMRLTGNRNTRAGIEVWPKVGDAVSVEYNASISSLRFGKYTDTWRYVEKRSMALPANRWFVLKFSVRGDAITVSLDGRPMFSRRRDLAGNVYGISLISSGNDAAEFDDVVAVRRPPR